MIDPEKLDAVMKARLPGWEGLVACEHLSSGASRETHKVTATVKGKERNFALRREPSQSKSVMGQGPGHERYCDLPDHEQPVLPLRCANGECTHGFERS